MDVSEIWISLPLLGLWKVDVGLEGMEVHVGGGGKTKLAWFG